MKKTLISTGMFFITYGILMIIFEGMENQSYLSKPYSFFGGIIIATIIFGVFMFFMERREMKKKNKNPK